MLKVLTATALFTSLLVPAVATAESFDRTQDAHLDRVVLFPTAETHSAGTMYYSNFDIAVQQLGYALTDSLQASVAGAPIPGEGGFFLAALKANVLRSEQWKAAVHGSYAYGETDEDSTRALLVGGAVQRCLEANCRSSASLSMTLGFPIAGGNENNIQSELVLGLGLLWRLTDWFALLAEPFLARSFRDPSPGLGYGVRISGRWFAVDLAAVSTFDSESDTLPVLPVVVGTFRIPGS